MTESPTPLTANTPLFALPKPSADALSASRLLCAEGEDGFGAGLSTSLQALVDSAAALSPYLSRLLRQQKALLAELDQSGAEASLVAILASVTDASDGEALRAAKCRCHLVLALAELGNLLPQTAIFEARTRFADLAVQRALALAASDLSAAGLLDTSTADPAWGPAPGLFILALGKHGGGELNFSSDIDLAIFFDRDKLLPFVKTDAQKVATRLAQGLSALLDRRTAGGYVERVDLRLRPDPGATQPAVTTAMAQRYYESFGQNWERAAYIKARPVAGDMLAATEFTTFLKSWVWRRTLDYAAISDIHSIKRQIHVHGRHGDWDDPGFDVKLGRGGIREIEFFAQVQQLILGGRKPHLRATDTLTALAALAAEGVISPVARDDLRRAYLLLRGVEHRLQMVDDEQTQQLPADPGQRLRIAQLCGLERLADFDAMLLAVRQRVHHHYAALFADDVPLADDGGSLVFTGVDDDPETLRTLRDMGYQDPAKVCANMRDWHRGHVRAMRSPRAREILTRIAPKLLRVLAETGEADTAFARFGDMLHALSFGVSTLAFLEAEPDLMASLARPLALSPRIAADLGRRPQLLDAMLEKRFARPLSLDEPGERDRSLQHALADAVSLEEAMNTMRRFKREESFRTGWQVLQGLTDAHSAGLAYAETAEVCVRASLAAARLDFARKQGDFEGRFVVLALGKLGGRELAAESDLDLMMVYAPPEQPSTQGIEVAAIRMAQRLVTALSAPTEEGELFEIDLQLRPDGKKGPVAVKAARFARYYADEAWTWELMALTRLRVVAGDIDLGQEIIKAQHEALQQPRDADKLAADALKMRALLAKERPPQGAWDLKLAPGGIVDLEFLAQTAMLKAANAGTLIVEPNTALAFEALSAAGVMDPGTARTCASASRTLLDLQHVSRILGWRPDEPFDSQSAAAQYLARSGAVSSVEALPDALLSLRRTVRAAFLDWFGAAATDSGLSPV